MTDNESKFETAVKEQLLPLLNDDETLLAYTNGQIRGATAKYYYVGLTESRLILQPYKRRKAKGQPLSIFLSTITDIKMARRAIRLKFVSDGTNIFVRQLRWRPHAKKLAEMAVSLINQTNQLKTQLTHEQVLAQTDDYYELGLLGTAQTLLHQAELADMSITIGPIYQTLKDRLTEKQHALRAACFILWTTLILSIILFIVSNNLFQISEIGPAIIAVFSAFLLPIVIDALITYHLWRGHSQGGWEAWALLRAGLSTILISITLLSEGFFLEAGAQIALAVAITLVLSGNPTRNKTTAGIVIYGLGHFGLLLISIFLA